MDYKKIEINFDLLDGYKQKKMSIQIVTRNKSFINKKGKKITIIDDEVKQFLFQADVWELIKEFMILTASNVKFKCRTYDDFYIVDVIWRKKDDRFFCHDNSVPTAKANYRWMTKVREHFNWEQMEKDDKIYFITKQYSNNAVTITKSDDEYFHGYIDYSGLVYYRHNFRIEEDVLLDCVYNDLLINTKSLRL